ncbi:hypothetical protein FACS1894190_02990 [Spirochaetia bacterium]|nr:hypothetical protein FACS1894190_02990 [Spirochaetia bacterium]
MGTRAVLRLIGPTIIGMAAYQLNDLVSTALAGNVGEGVVSSLQYSLRLQELILGVFAVSIGTVLLPELSEHAKARNWLMYNKRLTSAIDIIALITIPVTIFSLIESEKIVRLLFQSRLFDDDSVRLTTQAFFFHITGLFFIALNRILAPAFYAQSDSKSPTIAGVASFVVNMALAALLSGPLKGAGIALALSIAGAANTLLLFFFFKRIAHINLKAMLINSLRYLIRMVIFSCIAAVPLMLLDKYINKIFTSISIAHIGSSRLITVAAPLVVSLLIFSTIGIALLFITGDGNLKSVLSIFGRKLKKHN